MADRQVTMRISLKSDDFKDDRTLDQVRADRRWNEHLGELTRIAFAGAWRDDVEAFEMTADVARLPEVDRLLGRCVRDAAQHNLGDAIDSARSAAAACREVPSLGEAVARIITILEAS